MSTRWKAIAGGLSLAAAAVVLSACSSSPSATSTTSTTSTTAASTTSTTAAPTTTTTAPTTTTTTAPTTTTTTRPPAPATTTAAVPTTCTVPNLRLADVGEGGAAGTQEVTFSLTNTSTATCGTYGYPGMLLLSTSGAALATTVDRGGSLTFDDFGPTHVTLAAGQTAYFNVGFTDVPTPTTTCSSAHMLEVTPPTNTTHTSVDLTLGIDACDNGTLNVSPVFASTDAAATQTTAPSQAG